ncbi:hypothetical protein KAW18_04975 [candidate division WOR-3 bacterium]|nr:hypothetical protein [candidate division WOR-3 bacterium]
MCNLILMFFLIGGKDPYTGDVNFNLSLTDINIDSKQEIFLTCEGGGGDGKGSAYFYDSDWNMLWSRDVQGNIGENFLTVFHTGKSKIEGKRPKFRLYLELEKIFFFSPYDSAVTLWELPKSGTSYGVGLDYSFNKGFDISLKASYVHRLPLKYHSYHPLDRAWFLKFVSIGGMISNRIYHPFGLPVNPYFGLGIDFCKSANVTDFLGGEYLTRRLPLSLGSRCFGGMNYTIRSFFTIDVSFGVQWLIVEGQEKEVYNLSGLYLGMKTGYIW